MTAVAWAQGPVTAKPAGGAIRVRPGDIRPDDNPREIIVLFGSPSVGGDLPLSHLSTVNVAQMDRTFKDIAGIGAPISGIVSLGGLVFNGAGDGGKTLVKRLEASRAFIKSSTKADFHCVLGSEARGALGVADPLAVEAWRSWTTSAGWSKINAKATHMDYAYTKGKSRMVFIDTEHPDGIDTKWLSAELAKDEADKDIEHVFIFGARPLVNPRGFTMDTLLTNFTAHSQSESARKLIVGKSKVVAYFCGEPAMVGLSELEADKRPYQIVIGNGGGPLNPAWTSIGGYGFSVVVVYPNGTVSIVPFDRPAPGNGQAFYSSEPEVPIAAKPKPEVTLWSRTRTGKTP